MEGNLAAWASGSKLYYTILNQPDLSVAPADIVFSNASPVEGTSIKVVVTVHNLVNIAAAGSVIVRLYDRDPDLPEPQQLGTDQAIPGGVPGLDSEPCTFAGIVIPVGWEPSHEIWAKVFPTGEDNPGNNKAYRDLTVSDSDTQGPIIGIPVIVDYKGDGDGAVGADEQIQISWVMDDPSEIASTELLVDGNPVTPVDGLPGGNPINASAYATLGPLLAGQHTYEIRATDGDTSPATSIRTGTFDVVNAAEITILYDALALTDGQTLPIDFGTVGQGAARPQRTIMVRNDGEQDLALGAISVPTGFAVTGPAVSVLLPGATTHFTVFLETGASGTFSGQVSLANSDGPRSPDGLDEGSFEFPVGGTVVPTVMDGGPGDDSYYIRLDGPGTDIEIFENVPTTEPPTYTVPLAAMPSVSINGHGGNDSLTIDAVNGDPTPAEGIIFDGGPGNDVLSMNGGTVTFQTSQTLGSLTITGAGKLDLNDNAMTLHYGAGPSPLATIAGWVASGYNGGGWDGNGIMSTAAQTTGYALGYADGAEGVVAGLAAGDIRVQYCLPGDVTLDGKVDGSDVDYLLGYYGTAGGASWTTADITYDGIVDGGDVDLFLGYYGASGPLRQGQAQFDGQLLSTDLKATNGLSSDEVAVSASAPAESARLDILAFYLGVHSREVGSTARTPSNKERSFTGLALPITGLGLRSGLSGSTMPTLTTGIHRPRMAMERRGSMSLASELVTASASSAGGLITLRDELDDPLDLLMNVRAMAPVL